MIPKRAVKEFLTRKRRNLQKRYIGMTDVQMRRAMQQLPVRPPVWKKLERDQRACLLAGARHRRIALWVDTGIGKTLVAMALARYWRRAGIARRVLVLVPNKINVAEWQAERDKHCPRTSLVLLEGLSENKWKTLEASDRTLLTVTTYAGLARMVCEKVEVTEGRRAGDVALKPIRRLVTKLTRTFDALIMDESSADQAVQYRSSLAWRVCRQISKDAAAVVAMSATPFGADPTPLWAQMFLVDQGAALGPTLGLFRAAFFTSETNEWGGEVHTFRTRRSATMHRLLAHSALSIEVDASTLPDVVERSIDVRLPHEASEYSALARDAVNAARGNYQETKNAFLRMRQISSGFLGYTDDESGERAKVEFPENPKMEALVSLVNSIASGYKVLIFHEFIYSGDKLCEALAHAGVEHVRIDAKTDAKPVRSKFVNDPKCRALVISNKFAQGPNLQVARYAIFYESPTSPKTRKQARRRVERQHSEHSRVFIYDLVAKGTYDQQILDAHARGEDLFQSIVRGRKKKKSDV